MRAIQYKPDFDIALANLGNAMKDIVRFLIQFIPFSFSYIRWQGRPSEAVSYYTRALKANPGLPEAVCGLGNSLMAICDWRGRGGTAPDIMIDHAGRIVDNTAAHPGWLPDMIVRPVNMS
jgi:protein O-GlcNAc transferase